MPANCSGAPLSGATVPSQSQSNGSTPCACKAVALASRAETAAAISDDAAAASDDAAARALCSASAAASRQRTSSSLLSSNSRGSMAPCNAPRSPPVTSRLANTARSRLKYGPADHLANAVNYGTAAVSAEYGHVHLEPVAALQRAVHLPVRGVAAGIVAARRSRRLLGTLAEEALAVTEHDELSAVRKWHAGWHTEGKRAGLCLLSAAD
eukprot:scaffold97730_cov43-Phaeocystis_antarctica.AAC.1